MPGNRGFKPNVIHRVGGANELTTGWNRRPFATEDTCEKNLENFPVSDIDRCRDTY